MKKLNPLAVISLRDQIADKKPLDQRAQYFTATLAIAIAMAIPVPVSVESPLDAFNTAYRGAYENVVYDINETVSVSVDRVRQMAFKLWEIRYKMVHFPNQAMYLKPSVFLMAHVGHVAPEIEALGIDGDDVSKISELLAGLRQD